MLLALTYLNIFFSIVFCEYSWNSDYNYEPNSSQDVMVDVINNLGLSLLEVHNENNENNIAFSPYGAAGVLIALNEGLQGDAAYEIRKTAKLPTETTVIRVGLRDIHRHLKSYFIPNEGFLAGLTLSQENITLNSGYEKIIEFYGYSAKSFNGGAYSDSYTTEFIPTVHANATKSENGEENADITDKGDITLSTITTEQMKTISETTVIVGNRDNAATITTTVQSETDLTSPIKESTTISTEAETVKTTNQYTTNTNLIGSEITTEYMNRIDENITPSEASTSDSVNDITESNIKPRTSVPSTTEIETKEPSDVKTTTNISTTKSIRMDNVVLSTGEKKKNNIENEKLTTSSTDFPEKQEFTTIAISVTNQETIATNSKDVTEEISTLQTNVDADVATPDKIISEMSSTNTESGISTVNILTTEILDTTAEPLDLATTETETPVNRRSILNSDSRISKRNTASVVPFPLKLNTLPLEKHPEITRKQYNVSTSTKYIKNIRRRSSRHGRSIIDYVIARYYDDYYPSTGNNDQLPANQLTFFINGETREPNINFMTYDTILPFSYIFRLNALALRFPLDSTKYYLLLILPIEDEGINRLVCNLRKTNLKDIITKLKDTHVQVIIPSFKLKGYISLTPTLQKLGIKRIFEPRRANFEFMTNVTDIYVTNIEQAITVTIRNYVDPANLRKRENIYYGPVEFKADHPFLYFVMDAELHVALMAGKIINPLNSRIR